MARDRLKLPVSQTLIKRNYPLSIVKQCWGEQLRIKGRSKNGIISLYNVHRSI